jgi:hypothetical protein
MVNCFNGFIQNVELKLKFGTDYWMSFFIYLAIWIYIGNQNWILKSRFSTKTQISKHYLNDLLISREIEDPKSALIFSFTLKGCRVTTFLIKLLSIKPTRLKMMVIVQFSVQNSLAIMDKIIKLANIIFVVEKMYISSITIWPFFWPASPARWFSIRIPLFG